MLKIRLRRMGSRHRPFYRFVVSDSRQVPTATAIDEVGIYNPILRPAEIRVDFAKVEHWLARGAQTSATVEKLLAQARKGTPASAAVASAEPAPSAPADPAPVAAAAVEAPAETVAEAAADEAAAAPEIAGEAEVEAEPAASEAASA